MGHCDPLTCSKIVRGRGPEKLEQIRRELRLFRDRGCSMRQLTELLWPEHGLGRIFRMDRREALAGQMARLRQIIAEGRSFATTLEYAAVLHNRCGVSGNRAEARRREFGAEDALAWARRRFLLQPAARPACSAPVAPRSLARRANPPPSSPMADASQGTISGPVAGRLSLQSCERSVIVDLLWVGSDLSPSLFDHQLRVLIVTALANLAWVTARTLPAPRPILTRSGA
jgi:hypothetical protein